MTFQNKLQAVLHGMDIFRDDEEDLTALLIKNAIVSLGETGAFVQAWVWVDKE